jgi:chromate reductase
LSALLSIAKAIRSGYSPANKFSYGFGCTPYALGAFGAQHHLRQVLVYLNMYPLQQPEFYLGKVSEKFNDQDELTDEPTKKLIRTLWTDFVAWINKVK